RQVLQVADGGGHHVQGAGGGVAVGGRWHGGGSGIGVRGIIGRDASRYDRPMDAHWQHPHSPRRRRAPSWSTAALALLATLLLAACAGTPQRTAPPAVAQSAERLYAEGSFDAAAAAFVAAADASRARRNYY